MEGIPPQFAALGIAEGESVVISRAQHEALMAAVKALEPFDRWYELNDCDGSHGVLEVPITDLRNARERLAALRAAGVHLEVKP